MSWIKIKGLRTNMDTGLYYRPYHTFTIDMNGQFIDFEVQEQRDNAIDKLDNELGVVNLLNTIKELGY